MVECFKAEIKNFRQEFFFLIFIITFLALDLCLFGRWGGVGSRGKRYMRLYLCHRG